MKYPDRPNRAPGFCPQQAPSPPGATSTPPGCLGAYLIAWHARSVLVWGPMCSRPSRPSRQRAVRGAERAHDPLHRQMRRNLTRSCGRPMVPCTPGRKSSTGRRELNLKMVGLGAGGRCNPPPTPWGTPSLGTPLPVPLLLGSSYWGAMPLIGVPMGRGAAGDKAPVKRLGNATGLVGCRPLQPPTTHPPTFHLPLPYAMLSPSASLPCVRKRG